MAVYNGAWCRVVYNYGRGCRLVVMYNHGRGRRLVVYNHGRGRRLVVVYNHRLVCRFMVYNGAVFAVLYVHILAVFAFSVMFYSCGNRSSVVTMVVLCHNLCRHKHCAYEGCNNHHLFHNCKVLMVNVRLFIVSV